MNFETDDSNNFPFSNVKITRKKKKRFVTSIFHKATFTGVFTNYDSFIFDTCKIGLFSPYTLLFRFFKICFIMKNVHIEIEHLRSIFKYNNYHVSIIDQCIKKFLDKFYVPKRELLVVLPFFGRFTLNLRKRLYKSVSKSLAQCESYFSVQKSTEYLFKFNDSIPL